MSPHEWPRHSTIYTLNTNICNFLFFLIRPQQKRVKDHKAMVEALKKGDEVITSGGIIGVVDRVMEDDRIEVIIGEGTKVQIIRSTITSLLKKEEVKNNSFSC